MDLVVTSPPYFALRSYTDAGEHYGGQIGSEGTPQEFIAALVECTAEMVRVLKPSGSIFINLGDKYATAQGPRGARGLHEERASGLTRLTFKGHGVREKSLYLLPERFRIACVDQLGLIARAVIVWDKPNGLPESVRDRVRRSHEDWVHLTKQPRYFSAIDEIREPHNDINRPNGPRGRDGVSVKGFVPGRKDGIARETFVRAHNDYNPLGKLPGSVWRIPTEPLTVPESLGVDHFAAYPLEWPLRLIAGWCPAGVCLDPFAGTGTTMLAAKALGRVGIGVDMSADYCRLAAWRTSDRGELAKAMRVEKPAPVPDGQGSIFDLVDGV